MNMLSEWSWDRSDFLPEKVEEKYGGVAETLPTSGDYRGGGGRGESGGGSEDERITGERSKGGLPSSKSQGRPGAF